MTQTVRAPSSALLLLTGGAVSAVASFLPWARMPVMSVRGTSTPWGVATLVAAAIVVVVGYRLARGHRAGTAARVVVLAAAGVAIVVPAIVAGEVHRSIVEERLEQHLAPHGLTAADVLGAEGHPSLFEQFAPFAGGKSAQLLAAMERTMTIRPDTGLWIALAGGMAMAVGALSTSVRRQRHVSPDPEPGVMTTIHTNRSSAGVAP